jgi:3-hydroxy-3-methylglutaryl CoA synthase
LGFFTKFAPPTCKQVKTALKNMGFEPQKQDGTSHEHWKKIVNGKLYKVTVGNWYRLIKVGKIYGVRL